MAKTPKRRTPPMTINRKKRDKNLGVIDRLHRTRQIKKLTKRLARTSDYLERLKIEAEIEGLRWKSKNSGEKFSLIRGTRFQHLHFAQTEDIWLKSAMGRKEGNSLITVNYFYIASSTLKQVR